MTHIKRKGEETWEEYKARRKEARDEDRERRKKKLSGKWIYNFPTKPVMAGLRAQGINGAEMKKRQDYIREMKKKGYVPVKKDDGTLEFVKEGEEE